MAALRVIVALSFLGVATGCASQSGAQEDLVNFVRSDSFSPRKGSVYPSLARPRQRVLMYVEAEYEANPDVRSELAYYFLRYDSALLTHGLLTVDARPGDLVDILWQRESCRNSEFRESPSNTLMRQWIENNIEWFSLSQEGRCQLAANDNEFLSLRTFWKEAEPDGL